VAYRFTIISIKPTRGGYGDELNLSAARICNLKYATFQPVAEDQDKPSAIKIRHRKELYYDLREGYRWAAGWRDWASGAWDQSREVYGGYVQVQVGGAQGNLKVLDQTLTGFNCLLTRTNMKIWPNPDDRLARQPLGLSARDWVCGTANFGGFLRQRLGNYDVDWDTGVEPIFSEIIFNNDYAPGSSIPEAPSKGRAFGYMKLRDACDQVIESIKRWGAGNGLPTIDPVIYFEPCVSPYNPNEIIPRLRMVNRNDNTTDPVAVYASHPLEGEWQVENTDGAFQHTRDWTEVATRIDVKSSGIQIGTDDLIEATAFNTEHSAEYLTTWQTDEGWADLIVDESIPDIATCQSLADTQEAFRWGADGRIQIRSSHFSRQGANILLNIPEEGQEYAPHRISDVTAVPNIGRPLWDIVLGAQKPDTSAIFTRQRVIMTHNYLLRKAGVAVGNPQSYGISTNPTHTGQNTVQPVGDQSVGVTHLPGYVPAGETPSTTPANQVEHKNGPGEDADLTAWHDATGVGHPHIIGTFTFTDSTPWDDIIAAKVLLATVVMYGTGSIILERQYAPGLYTSYETPAFVGTTTGGGRVYQWQPAIDLARYDRIRLVPLSLSSSDPLLILLAEDTVLPPGIT
jgi:hypothetical protein